MLPKYYIPFEEAPVIYFDDAVFDDGVPLLLKDGRLIQFPVQIAQWGLYLMNRFFAGETELKTEIEHLARHCLKIAIEQNGEILWDMAVQRPDYGLNPPWFSAMAQGEMISFLIRAGEITGDEVFFTAAKKAGKPMFRNVADGGLLGEFPDGSPCLEEYPSRPSACVLNGMIFAIFGLYDYVKTFGADDKLLKDSSDALKNNLHRYDCGYWSRYDLYHGGIMASRTYHWLHIKQLEALSRLDGFENCGLEYYAKKFKKYENFAPNIFLRNLRRFYEKKITGR